MRKTTASQWEGEGGGAATARALTTLHSSAAPRAHEEYVPHKPQGPR